MKGDNMKVTEVLKLRQKAKRFGGDKYADDQDRLIIYIPQYISREGSISNDKGYINMTEPRQTIKVTFED